MASTCDAPRLGTTTTAAAASHDQRRPWDPMYETTPAISARSTASMTGRPVRWTGANRAATPARALIHSGRMADAAPLCWLRRELMDPGSPMTGPSDGG